jgi:hypothetical protein
MKCVIVNPERIPAAEKTIAKDFSSLINTDPVFRQLIIQDLIKRGFIKPKTKQGGIKS